MCGGLEFFGASNRFFAPTTTSSTSPNSDRLEPLDSRLENSGALKSRMARNKVRRSSGCSSHSRVQVGNPTVSVRIVRWPDRFGPRQAQFRLLKEPLRALRSVLFAPCFPPLLASMQLVRTTLVSLRKCRANHFDPRSAGALIRVSGAIKSQGAERR